MDVQFTVKGTSANASLALPPGGTGPGVLLLHSWWGLNSFFKGLAERLANEGFVVLAPDLNNGEIAGSVDEAKAIQGRGDMELKQKTLMAAAKYLLAHPACTSRKLGVVGFSMGAAWSVALAVLAPEQVAAGVLFYGTYGGLDFGQIQAKIQGHFSDVDEWEPLEDTRAFEKELKAAGVDTTFSIYPGVSHWFIEEDRPEYDAQAATLAWERTVAFLKENLG